jgi:predicted lipoprotein with Yx(FWY)xxD motif
MKKLLGILGLPLFLAACTGAGGLYGTPSSTSAPASGAYGAAPSSSATAAAATAVTTAQNAKLGTVLVNANGRTLYYFIPERGGKLVCVSSACTNYWPPALSPSAATPTGPTGVTGQFAAIGRGSSEQITYNHWPLYTFSGDTAAGQTSGQALVAFGGEWLVATPGLQP